MATERESVKRKRFDDIRSSIIRPSLTSYFAVEIPLPPGSLGSELQEVLGTNQGTMNLMCSETSLPGSQLATLDITNDATGVTEKHAYRRQFDDRIDFTFYVDAEQYLPIRFFETWMRSIVNEDPEKVANNSTVYRTKYPNDYIADQGLKIYKFERDYTSVLTYEFFRSFPLSISSMPVSYDGNNLLKCSVSMSYIRYVQSGPSQLGGAGGSLENLFGQTKESLLSDPNANPFSYNPLNQAAKLFNNGTKTLKSVFSGLA